MKKKIILGLFALALIVINITQSFQSGQGGISLKQFINLAAAQPPESTSNKYIYDPFTEWGLCNACYCFGGGFCNWCTCECMSYGVYCPSGGIEDCTYSSTVVIDYDSCDLDGEACS